jgi:hypothetical protein
LWRGRSGAVGGGRSEVVGILDVYAALSFWSKAKILEAIAHRFHRERAERREEGELQRRQGQGGGGILGRIILMLAKLAWDGPSKIEADQLNGAFEG